MTHAPSLELEYTEMKRDLENSRVVMQPTSRPSRRMTRRVIVLERWPCMAVAFR